MQWSDILTAALALYGAVLSTLVFLDQRSKDKSQVKVSLTFGMIEFIGQGLSDPQLLITAANTGNRPVTLSSAFLQLPNGKTVVFPRPLSTVNFPHELQPGKNCIVWSEPEKIAAELREEGFTGTTKLKGAYRDETGKEYMSKPLKFNLDKWRIR